MQNKIFNKTLERGRSILNEQKKGNSIVESAIIGNVGHVVIVLILSLMMSFIAQFKTLSFYDFTRMILLVLTYILTLFFWFNIGIRSTKKEKRNSKLIGLVTAITSILPAGFFTVLCHILSISQSNASNLSRWNIFYLLGGPTLFWHRPFSFISEIVSINGYLIFYINLLLVALSIFLGGIFFKKSSRGLK